ncbi:putative Glycine-rich RNA-binding protein [Quillaja saponaria]|uniref:Glycine-rich RNA-binding protein n=1 Tax=Quillaja saponaria TaxID=32244 RepID=A0AAD7VCS3_QUISA|nr:putative Glycine-rich RNA-binding protein [Quillaja saponaria]
MALINKIGNLLKQSASSPSIYQTIRCMSSSKLFVGDDTSLREAFAQYGEIMDAKVITDRETGRSKGFGFITFSSSEEASSAMQGMNGQDLDGRRIGVNYATERSRPSYGGGNYGSGGFGGGSYGAGGSFGGGNYGGGSGSNYQSGSFDFGKSGLDGGSASRNSGGDGGFSSSEFSGIFGSGSNADGGQLGSNQTERSGLDDGELGDILKKSLGDNDDEPDDHANSRG